MKIVTPDGLIFDGRAEEVIVRTTSGDMGILAGHISCAAPLGMGRATIITDGKKSYVNRTGNAGMATAGSGDVLTGIIAGVLAGGIDVTEIAVRYGKSYEDKIFVAVALAVYIHGMAGDNRHNAGLQRGRKNKLY